MRALADPASHFLFKNRRGRTVFFRGEKRGGALVARLG
jgi:hypothetical protein